MLEPNARYQIAKAGAWLQCWQGYRLTHKLLQIGDMVTYQGEQMGQGSDNVNQPVFTTEGFTGEFRPNFWGVVDPAYLQGPL